MNTALMNTNDQQTMSSRVIAELTGKQHKHVMDDIRTMCQQMEIDSAEFSAQYKDSTGRTLPCFELDRYHTEVLVTGYDVKRRAAVIKRWYDLEAGAAQPIRKPQSNLDVLQTMIDSLREQEEQVYALKSQVDAITKGEAFFTVVGYANKLGQKVNNRKAQALGRMAAQMCKREGIDTGTAPHPLFGDVKTYPAEILDLAFDLVQTQN